MSLLIYIFVKNIKSNILDASDLRMTTDDIGPLTDDLSDGENDTSAKRGVSTRRSVAAKKSKPTPVRNGAKNKPKQKKKKNTKESAEFQEIVEEAELITESINELENEQMKMEAGSDHVYEGEGDDYDVFDDFSDDGDNDMTPSTSDVSPSKDLSAFTTPSKKRKLDATGESASTGKGSIKVSNSKPLVFMFLLMSSDLKNFLKRSILKKTFFKIDLLKKFFQEHYQSVKPSISGPIELLS